MKKLFESWRSFLNEIIEEGDIEKIKNLKPNDLVRVYHGTSLNELNNMINGFDATEEHSRMYNGPDHSGIFVTSDLDLAIKFANYGQVVFELSVRAKNLHGTDYSGRIGREQDMDNKTKQWIKEKYPNSFRPYLSMTMLQEGEPQALLKGLVSPKNIRKIRIDQSLGKSKGKWYTREELLKSDLNLGDKEVKDIEFDLSSTKIKLEDFLEYLKKRYKKDDEKIKQIFKRMHDRDPKYGIEDTIGDLLGMKMGEKAKISIANKIKKWIKEMG